MENFPNLPPPSGAAPAPRPGRGATVADAPVRRTEPAQKPLLLGTGEIDLPALGRASKGGNDDAVFLSDRDFMDDLMKERHTLPVVALLAALGASIWIYATRGYAAGESAGAMRECLGLAIALGIASVGASGAAWLVAKIFGDDFGSLPGLLLRFSAVAVVAVPVFNGLNLVLESAIMALIFSYPVMLVVMIWVGGIGFFRALIVNVMLGIIYLCILSGYVVTHTPPPGA